MKRNIVGFLIPDHMSERSSHLKIDEQIIHRSDFYYVTNLKLFEYYKKIFPSKPPSRVIHDIPNVDLINQIRRSTPKLNNTTRKIIWVGNAKWGRAQGYNDHKGLATVVEPLRTIFRNHNNCMELIIIDSSKEFYEYSEVLLRIREADFLLQVSDSEGTGLPLVEALGLGTDVLTTKVGVSEEIFDLNEHSHFVSRNPNEIHNLLHEKIEMNSTEYLNEIYENYIFQAQNESIGSLKKTIFSVTGIKIPLYQWMFTKFIWKYRFFKPLIAIFS
jgi:hypothetical protein